VNRSFLITAGKYGFGFALLGAMIWWKWEPQDGSPGLGQIVQGPIYWKPLGIASTCLLVSLFLSFVRWLILVRALGLPFTLTNAVRLGLIGYYWSIVFPGSVGGDVVKAYCISREQKRRSVAVATVLIDRGVGLWALFWLVALAGSGFWMVGDPTLLAQPALQKIVLVALGLVAITTLLWAVLIVLPERRGEKFAWRLGRIPKVGSSAAEFWRAVWMYRDRQYSIIASLLLALVGHVGWVLTFYFAVQTFVGPADLAQIPSLAEHFLIVPCGMIGRAFIPTPGGVGGGEAVYGALYVLLGKSMTLGIVGSLAQYAINCGVAMFGYLVYLRMPRAERIQGSWSHAEESDDSPAQAAEAGESRKAVVA
jgi:uncharacterized protein (TIRG00374 family)